MWVILLELFLYVKVIFILHKHLCEISKRLCVHPQSLISCQIFSSCHLWCSWPVSPLSGAVGLVIEEHSADPVYCCTSAGAASDTNRETDHPWRLFSPQFPLDGGNSEHISSVNNSWRFKISACTGRLCYAASHLSHPRRLLFSCKYAYSSNIYLHTKKKGGAASLSELLKKSFSNRDVFGFWSMNVERVESHSSSFGHGERYVFTN